MRRHEHRLASDLAHIAFNLTALQRSDEALLHLGRAFGIVAALSAAEPLNTMFRRGLWNVLLERGRAKIERGHVAAGLSDIRMAIATKQSLAAADPGDTGHRRGLSVSYLAEAGALSRLGRLAEAATVLDRAAHVAERLVSDDPLHFESLLDLAEIESAKAELLLKRGRRDQALPHLQRSAALFLQCRNMSRGHDRVIREHEAIQLRLTSIAGGSKSQLSGSASSLRDTP